MEPIIALLALVAQLSIRQEAIIAALDRKNILSRGEIQKEMPGTERDVGNRFDAIKGDFFEIWSKLEDGIVQ